MMKTFLIVKIAAIGDVIMALPMAVEIKRRYPDSHITWICGKSVKSIVEMAPVDEVITLNEKKLLTGSKTEKIIEVIKAWKKIGFRHFDQITIGHADPRYQILTKLTLAIKITSFNHTIGKTWPIPSRHHTDEYVRLVNEDMNKKRPIPAFQYSPLKDNLIDTALAGSHKIITLTPGGAKNLLADDFCRRWPINNYVELAIKLINKGYIVVISGAKSDEWILPYFSGLNIVNMVGKTDLNQLLYLFSKSDFVVTHDSGPMHLAGMTKCHLIAIFGPTNPYEKIPRRKNVYFFWNHKQYSCCPCYDGKSYAKCSDNICMKEISADDILTKISSINEESADRS